MPFLLAEILNFQGSTHRYGVGSFSKIDKKSEVPYTHIKIASSLKVNSRIKLYGKNGVVNGIIKRITFLDPSTDVEPGDTPPIKRPGGH